MSKKESGISELRARMAAAKAERAGFMGVVKEIVNVPQAQAVFVPVADRAGHPVIASRGIATCVGLIVAGERGVFFAHIDSNSEPFVSRIAGVALGMVGRVTRIWVTTSHRLPAVSAQGEPERPWRADVSAERIFRRLMEIFVDFPEVAVQRLELTDAAYTFATGTVGQAFPYPGDEHQQKPGVRYLSLLDASIPTLQWPA